MPGYPKDFYDTYKQSVLLMGQGKNVREHHQSTDDELCACVRVRVQAMPACWDVRWKR